MVCHLASEVSEVRLFEGTPKKVMFLPPKLPLKGHPQKRHPQFQSSPSNSHSDGMTEPTRAWLVPHMEQE